MSLADRAQIPPRGGTMCAVCRLLDEMPESEADALRGMMAQSLRSNQSIADDLAAEGYHLPVRAPRMAINYHRSDRHDAR